MLIDWEGEQGHLELTLVDARTVFGCHRTMRAHQQTPEAVPRGRAWPPSPGRHLGAHSVAIAHLPEVGRSHRRDCISTATRLHSVCNHSVTVCID